MLMLSIFGLAAGWNTDIRRDADSDPSRRRYLALHFKMVSRDENEHSGFSLSSQGSFCFSYIALLKSLRFLVHYSSISYLSSSFKFHVQVIIVAILIRELYFEYDLPTYSYTALGLCYTMIQE